MRPAPSAGRSTGAPQANGSASSGNAASSQTPSKIPLPKDEHDDAPTSFGVVRSLAWVAMALTIILSVLAALYLGNTADNTLIKKNHSFASLLAANLNNQIARRFTMPTLTIFGSIDLDNDDQYKALDQVVQSILQGLNVHDLRIYSDNNIIRYALDKSEVGKWDIATPLVAQASTSEGPIFEIISTIPYWQAFFKLGLDPGTFVMRTTYPLRFDSPIFPRNNQNNLMGILEFSQDVTQDIQSGFGFQHLVLGVSLLSSGMLMFLLMFLVRRAERALAIRMREQQRLQSELHQHEKLAGMGRVVASIAHEIRNPLGIISSSAELLLRRSSPSASPGTSKILQAIYDEAKRLSRTVSDFLDYARPQQPRHDPVDTGSVVTQAITFLGPDMNERDIGVVRTGLIDAPLMVPGDKDLLYRAFYNIMGNAVQAMGASGTLTIHFDKISGPPEQVCITFHDSGPGFPENYMAQLLDPFFTTKDDGTGLGLPIMNNIITGHGGVLELFNAPEGGAMVRVTLPALDQPKPQEQ
ncbi:two-component sensor histidine kinase [Desulfovibrio sp. OttesenSCG-928-G15]|nr:two-component sensor histidine kinase [Desulfovibrio sp. OttesenSCG-928-G15]